MKAELTFISNPLSSSSNESTISSDLENLIQFYNLNCSRISVEVNDLKSQFTTFSKEKLEMLFEDVIGMKKYFAFHSKQIEEKIHSECETDFRIRGKLNDTIEDFNEKTVEILRELTFIQKNTQ